MVSKNRALIDSVSRSNGFGNLSQTTANAFKGINHRGVGNPTKMNTDNHGITFFTRPCLNLSYDNLAQTRLLSSLMTDDANTLARAIRVLLDPWGNVGVGAKNIERVNGRGITSTLIDPLNPFMPVLTNNLLSISGWPDPNIDTYTSPEGWAKEQWSIVDDFPVNYGSFDLTANFRNVEGDPINALFYVWHQYMTRVLSGDMVPYPEMITDNCIDYMTRIYRLVLDPTRTYIQKIANCGVAFPTAYPLGAAFNYNQDDVFDTANQQISIPFRCLGAEYNDPIAIREFNQLVGMYNPSMRQSELNPTPDPKTMRKLTNTERDAFNYEGYPFISQSNELEWWVTNETYASVMRDLELDPNTFAEEEGAQANV